MNLISIIIIASASIIAVAIFIFLFYVIMCDRRTAQHQVYPPERNVPHNVPYNVNRITDMQNQLNHIHQQMPIPIENNWMSVVPEPVPVPVPEPVPVPVPNDAEEQYGFTDIPLTEILPEPLGQARTLMISNDNSCCVCLDDMKGIYISKGDTITRANCGHIFHKSCIYEWLYTQSGRVDAANCPFCRTEVSTLDHYRNGVLQTAHRISRTRSGNYNVDVTYPL
jgi:hypothetical protein